MLCTVVQELEEEVARRRLFLNLEVMVPGTLYLISDGKARGEHGQGGVGLL